MQIQPGDLRVLRNSPVNLNFTDTAPNLTYVADQDHEPISSTLIAGSLATGLTLANNTISGIPTAAVDNLLTIRFADLIGDSVDLTLRLNVDVGATVPDLTGLTTSDASTVLSLATLSLDPDPDSVNSETVAAGAIVSQVPPPGSFVFSGSQVAVVVSAGVAPSGTFDGTVAVAGTSAAGVGDYTTRVGRYIRLGDTIFVRIELAWSTHTGTGNLEIVGLPFAADGAASTALAVYLNDLAISSGYVVQGVIARNAEEVTISQYQGPSGAAVPVPMDGTVTSLVISGWYPIRTT